MTELQYRQVDGYTDLYDVVQGGEIVGIAWRRDGAWYADPNSMLNPKFCGTDRGDVAAQMDLAHRSDAVS